MQVGTWGNPKAKILIVGEAYGAEEERQNRPFVGASGRELTKILIEAQIDPRECYYTNVVNRRPPQNKIHKFFLSNAEAKAINAIPTRGLYPNVEVLEGIILLEELINKLNPTIIIALGNYALWALAEEEIKYGVGGNDARGYRVAKGIVQYRGSMMYSRFNGIPLLPAFHPAACLRNWPWRYLLVHDLKARVPLAFEGKWEDRSRNFMIHPTLDQVMSTINNIILRAELAKSPIFLSCDIETRERFIECVGIAWSMQDALCIPIMRTGAEENYWTVEEEILVWQALRTLLEHPNIIVFGQNFFYDFQYFWYYYQIKPNYQQDTMLAHHVCFPGTTMGLDYLSSLYCEFHRYWKDDGKEASKNLDNEQRWIYNCRDCVVTYEVLIELHKVIEHYGLQTQYALQMVRARAATQMMIKGVKIDEAKRKQELLIQLEATQEFESFFHNVMPHSIHPPQPKKAPWFRSNQQLAEIFYDTLNMTPVKNRKTHNVTVDDEALRLIGQREPLLQPVTEKLQQYRSLKVFGDFLGMKTGQDKRMRATFSPTTETFRYRSSADVFGFGRNLQNLPKGKEEE